MDRLDLNKAAAGSRSLGVLPFWHIYGMNCGLNSNLLNGGCFTLMSKFDPAEFLTIIQKEKIERAHLVPPILIFSA